MHRAVTTADGQEIAARFFDPEGTPRGAVLIAGDGCARSTPAVRRVAGARGSSRRPSITAARTVAPAALPAFARHLRLGGLDCAAMIDARPPVRCTGSVTAWAADPRARSQPRSLSKAITVATGSGYWRENTPRIRLWWLWFVAAPLALPLWLFPRQNVAQGWRPAESCSSGALVPRPD